MIEYYDVLFPFYYSSLSFILNNCSFVCDIFVKFICCGLGTDNMNQGVLNFGFINEKLILFDIGISVQMTENYFHLPYCCNTMRFLFLVILSYFPLVRFANLKNDMVGISCTRKNQGKSRSRKKRIKELSDGHKCLL